MFEMDRFPARALGHEHISCISAATAPLIPMTRVRPTSVTLLVFSSLRVVEALARCPTHRNRPQHQPAVPCAAVRLSLPQMEEVPRFRAHPWRTTRADLEWFQSLNDGDTTGHSFPSKAGALPRVLVTDTSHDPNCDHQQSAAGSNVPMLDGSPGWLQAT